MKTISEPQSIIESSRASWSVLVMALATAALALGVCLLFLFIRKNDDLDAAMKRLSVQNNARISALQAGIDALKQDGLEQKAALAGDKQRTDDMAREIVGINSDLLATHQDVFSVKQEMKDWQKEYVSALVKVESNVRQSVDRIHELDEELRQFQEQTARNTDELKQGLQSLKFVLDQAVSTLPASDPATQSMQRRLHPDLIKD
ncbi:MAG: hypothetical protein HQL22_09790 [Candidatus Omnitrophica bacterium]|nr:hypothetical protein [Candidatus Omnitrophota bacterium]